MNARSLSLTPGKAGDIHLICAERDEGTLSLSAFIFKVLGSEGWVGARNFPPHRLVTIVTKYTKVNLA
jgi:hypothetical protein